MTNTEKQNVTSATEPGGQMQKPEKVCENCKWFSESVFKCTGEAAPTDVVCYPTDSCAFFEEKER